MESHHVAPSSSNLRACLIIRPWPSSNMTTTCPRDICFQNTLGRFACPSLSTRTFSCLCPHFCSTICSFPEASSRIWTCKKKHDKKPPSGSLQSMCLVAGWLFSSKVVGDVSDQARLERKNDQPYFFYVCPCSCSLVLKSLRSRELLPLRASVASLLVFRRVPHCYIFDPVVVMTSRNECLLYC